MILIRVLEVSAVAKVHLMTSEEDDSSRYELPLLSTFNPGIVVVVSRFFAGVAFAKPSLDAVVVAVKT